MTTAMQLFNSLSDLVDQVAQMTAPVSSSDGLMWNNRYSAITLNRSLLSAQYMEHGIIQCMIDQPVDDAFRGGIEIHCDQLDADDIDSLKHFIEDENILHSYAQAKKWTRLFGGGGLILNCNQDPIKPFDMSKINEQTPIKLYPVDRWEIGFVTTGMIMNQFERMSSDMPYNYYGVRLHKSHVLRMTGKEAPSLLRGQLGGWGMSEIERCVRSFNMYLKNQSVAYELLDEAKVDIFSIAGLNDNLASPAGTEITARRIALAAKLKNYQNALVVDKEDSYDSKAVNFSGLSDIMNDIRKGVAADLRMPITKLFGISASGFNSGEDDLESYNSMVEAEIRWKSKGDIMALLRVCCMKLFGFVPDRMRFEFTPLRVMTHEQENLIKNDKLNRITSAHASGFMSSEMAAKQINAEHLFAQDLDESEVMELEEKKAMQAESDGGGSDKTEVPGGGSKVL